MEMLAEAVAEARGQPLKPDFRVDLNLGVNAVLPPDYIPQPGERLTLYRRLARLASDAEASLLFEEMTDRFGKMPIEARFCLESARIRWRAQALSIPTIRADRQGVGISFTAASPIDPAALLVRVQSEPGRFRLTPDGNLTLLKMPAEKREQLKGCIAFLDELLPAI